MLNSGDHVSTIHASNHHPGKAKMLAQELISKIDLRNPRIWNLVLPYPAKNFMQWLVVRLIIAGSEIAY
jgi:hypothetical protein